MESQSPRPRRFGLRRIKGSNGMKDPCPPIFSPYPSLGESGGTTSFSRFDDRRLQGRGQRRGLEKPRVRRAERTRTGTRPRERRTKPPSNRAAGEGKTTAIFPVAQTDKARLSFTAPARPLSRDREGLWEKRGRGGQEKEARTRGGGRAEAASGAPGSRRGGKRRD